MLTIQSGRLHYLVRGKGVAQAVVDSHRMVAELVGLLTVTLAIWLARSEKRRWVKILGWLAVGTVVLQGVLGGLTVLYFLPAAISTAHAAVAQTFFCLAFALHFTGVDDLRPRGGSKWRWLVSA